jgi:diacylglycerol kinase
VIGAEVLNTSIENLVDLATEEFHKKAMIAKDTAAAYVMVLSITAAIIGLIIFVPKIVEVL